MSFTSIQKLLLALSLVILTVPMFAQASQTVFSGTVSGDYGAVPVMTYLPGGEACNFYDGCTYYAPGYTAFPVPVKQIIDEDGTQYHASNPDSLTFGNGLYSSWNIHAGSSANQGQFKTGGKVCGLIDSTATASSWTNSSYNRPQDNKLVRWGDVSPFTVWQKANANDIGNSYIENLICKTNALPANTLSASPTRIDSGESSTLSFDVGPNALIQGTTCTASNFTVPTHTKTRLDNVPAEYDCDLEGNCTPRRWMPVAIDTSNPVQQEQDASASLTVSPTVTTTYTYSCTNGNGTTVRSATVTVDENLVPADATLSANPTSIAPSATSRLTWTSTNATSCSSSNIATGGATAGAVDVAPTTTTTYSVSCIGPGGSSAVKYATVTVTGQSDLSAGPVTPTTAIAGSAVTLSSTIANNGSVSTGAGFTSTFEIDADTNHTTVTTTLTNTSTTLASGATTPTTVSQNFPSAGIWYSRACADSTNAIVESNENNNCSPWVAVTVSAPSAPNLTAANITNTTATVGTPVTLSSLVSNSGNASTGTGFTNLFQTATDAAGTGAADIGTHTNGVLAASGSGNATLSYTFSSTGATYVRACADKSSAGNAGSITEDNEGDNCGAWSMVTVTGAQLPDLTAGTVSPTSATEDSPVTLSSTVLNIGSRATGGSFPNIFQIENGALIPANTSSSLAVGASSALSTSYTFTSAGTYRVRACVDNNSSWVGSIAESNEGNNCGEYTSIVVNACSGVGCSGYTGTLSCSASNGNPLVGQTVTFTATPGGGATGPYVWTASDGASGLGTNATASRTFSSPGTYAMNVSSATGANASCSPQVSVGCGVATATISASQTRVTKGSTSTLTIPALTGVDGTCTVKGPGVDRTLTATSCGVPATSFSTGAITTLSTYTLSCDGGENTANVIVNVIPGIQEF